jgi:hypothetical protein
MAFLFSAAWLSKKLDQKLLLAFVSQLPHSWRTNPMDGFKIYTLPNIAGTIVFLSKPI